MARSRKARPQDVDEICGALPETELGTSILYPPWLEHHRGEWDPQLEPIKVNDPAVTAA